MKFNLQRLELELQREREVVDLTRLSYFWGQMGAGKTSIVRLVDYCLGGDIQLTPALQAEFVSVTLTLELQKAVLQVERPRDSHTVFVSWDEGGQTLQYMLPARRADGEVISGTEVETLSDLLFYLSDVRPPRVRQSKTKEDSKTVRLSMRDLLWYCYLDQDHIDSDFFHLHEEAQFAQRLKSRDVLRYVIGYHTEKVADLEAELDQLRASRIERASSIAALTKTLSEVGVESEQHIREREQDVAARLSKIEAEIESVRQTPRDKQTEHAVERLESEARNYGQVLWRLDGEVSELQGLRERHIRHRNEIEMLGAKFRRSASAREVLQGVGFESCPRCAQNLPERGVECCSVCGQTDQPNLPDPTELAALEADVAGRKKELEEAITSITSNIARARSDRADILKKKSAVEANLNRAKTEQDTAYLSMALLLERTRTELTKEMENLTWLKRLPRMLEEQREALAHIRAMEISTREKLNDSRTKAEADRSNLELFSNFFLDCLVRSHIPGIEPTDRVDLKTPTFYPEIYSADPNDLTVTSFSSLSSGGKKTLFKCCYALALHRIAARLNAPLPQLLIIDSPMKNISERENRDQFEGFYRMVYELAASELIDTQIILIDKEFFPAPKNLSVEVKERHMRPNDDKNPPLLRRYRGK